MGRCSAAGNDVASYHTADLGRSTAAATSRPGDDAGALIQPTLCEVVTLGTVIRCPSVVVFDQALRWNTCQRTAGSLVTDGGCEQVRLSSNEVVV